ncbi:hypothetical protein JCM3770_000402 [Rhodotorula araucariae]
MGSTLFKPKGEAHEAKSQLTEGNSPVDADDMATPAMEPEEPAQPGKAFHSVQKGNLVLTYPAAMPSNTPLPFHRYTRVPTPHPDPSPTTSPSRRGPSSSAAERVGGSGLPPGHPDSEHEGLEREPESSQPRATSGGERGEDRRDETPQKRTRRHPRGKTVWFESVHDAFVRAVHLLPDIGTARYPVLGQDMQRNEMICEYIRRQTGEARSVTQVSSYFKQVRNASSTSSKLKAALKGRSVPDEELARIDWDTLLGPDRCSLAKLPTSESPPNLQARAGTPPVTASTSGSSSQPAKVPKLEHGTSPGWALLSTPLPPAQLKQQSPCYPQSLIPPPPAFHPSPPVFHHASPQPLTQTPTSAEHPFFHHLVAFLSIAAGRDYSLSAEALLDCGITTPTALADLLLLDSASLNGFFDLLSRRTRLGGLELAWLKKAVAAATDVAAFMVRRA